MATDDEVAELHWSADEILTVLSRESEPVDKTDLIEKSGLSTDDLRTGLTSLVEARLIEDTEKGFVVSHEGSSRLAIPEDNPDEYRPGEVVSPGTLATLMSGDALDPEAHGIDYRVTLEMTGTFGKGRAESTEAALERAQAIATEIGNLLGIQMPHFIKGGSVTVARLEAVEMKVLFDGVALDPEEQ